MSQFTDDLRAQVDQEFEAQKAQVFKDRVYAKIEEAQNELNGLENAAAAKREELAQARAEIDGMFPQATPEEGAQG